MTWLNSGSQGHSRPSRSNLVNTMSDELLEQSRWNLLDETPNPWCYVLEVKGQGHTLVQVCGGECIHVDAGVSNAVV